MRAGQREDLVVETGLFVAPAGEPVFDTGNCGSTRPGEV